MVKSKKQKDHLEKLKLFHIGRKRSLETRLNISKSRKGKKLSEKARRNISLGKLKSPTKYWLGKHLSEKHKKKIGLANLKHGLTGTKEYENWSWRNHMIKKKGNGGFHTLGDWQLLKAQYNFTCPSCNKKEPEIKLTEDHIIPISKGGSNNIENIQPLCLKCNQVKHTKIIKYKI